MIRRRLAAVLMALVPATVVAGQRAGRTLQGAVPQRGAARGQGANRAGLELQLRQKFARRVQVVLGLGPDQMTKLADVNRRFGQQQRALDQRENQTRQALRRALLEAPSADQEKRVAELHDQVMQMQRQRLDLIDGEQRELAGFMTTVQRVRFQAMQENLRRQLQEGRQQAALPGTRGGTPPR